ncbi:hypothetical protein [Methanothermobacter sp.]|uniref:hypothetical protein n=1 Tax=Methanothermobacter sp. TaxID=1884223 RepID=UPI00261D3859|nr:hypothetical protein [Methanothermobacter sp.]MDI9618522.1 hypothetical protein [Methanothermobacter sp.]
MGNAILTVRDHYLPEEYWKNILHIIVQVHGYEIITGINPLLLYWKETLEHEKEDKNLIQRNFSDNWIRLLTGSGEFFPSS